MSAYQSPYSGSRRWLRGNLHMHTCCGPYTDLAESGPLYREIGYHFLAVTDHDKVPEEESWEKWCKAATVTLIPGVERSVPEHILDIGVHRLGEVVSGDYAASARLLRSGGGFLIGGHPQEYPDGAARLREGAPALHAMEVYNGLRADRGCDECANITLWDELLTAGERLWAVATDDYHKVYITPGHGWVCVEHPGEGEEVTWPEIVAQLKAGAFYAANGPGFACIRWDGNTVQVEADDVTEVLRFIGPGGQLLDERAVRELSWEPPAGLGYFRIEAVCGEKRAWSQPFFAAQGD